MGGGVEWAGWAAAAKDNPGHTKALAPTGLCSPSLLTGPCAFLQSEKVEQSGRRSDKWGETGGQVVQEQSCLDKLDWPCFPPVSLVDGLEIMMKSGKQRTMRSSK